MAGDVKLTMREVLDEFVNDINATGGIFQDRKGMIRPVGDPCWIDLASTYLRACQVLNRKPLKGDDPGDWAER